MIETIAGIEYKRPQVYLMNESGLGVAEFAGRTAYNSFDKSEHLIIKQANNTFKNKHNVNYSESYLKNMAEEMNDIESSDLLNQLAHVYHHDSVLEHINLQYFVKGTSRGVLQEHARHRIQSLTVQSTRYTMSSIINAFIASSNNYNDFKTIIDSLNIFIVSGVAEEFEIQNIFYKLHAQEKILGKDEFLKISLSKDNIEYIQKQNKEVELMNNDKVDSCKEKFKTLESNKQKRNVGDNFKWLVTDNWKVDLVFTMNLRALSNYLKLRDSGAAYFQIQWLAEEIIKATPQKYLNLISKKYKEA